MSKRIIILLVAGLIAAVTAVSVKNRLAQAPVNQAASGPVASRVLVAKRDLAPGNFVQGAQDLDWAAAPAGSDNENYLREGAANIADYNGAVVRRQLHAGEPVQANALMRSGEGGFMSAVLDPGKRAVSIAVNATSGNAGFVSPGDHVDLIVTHHVKTRIGAGDAGMTEDSVVSETFVRDVRVVAVDQMLDNPENKAILAKTVTVEVTPRQAEQIAVAAEMGKLSVALRSLAPAPKSTENAPVVTDKTKDNAARELTDLYGNVTSADNANANGSYTRESDVTGIHSNMVPRVQVIRGDRVQNLEFYSGEGQ